MQIGFMLCPVLSSLNLISLITLSLDRKCPRYLTSKLERHPILWITWKEFHQIFKIFYRMDDKCLPSAAGDSLFHPIIIISIIIFISYESGLMCGFGRQDIRNAESEDLSEVILFLFTAKTQIKLNFNRNNLTIMCTFFFSSKSHWWQCLMLSSRDNVGGRWRIL